MKGRGGNSLRIIGGEWRGRKVSFPDQAGLRPTGDRVRETLFNWLQPIISGARCLDLFAGSGVLGLEALSRGAAQVVMVEQAAPVCRYLQQAADNLGAQGRLEVNHTTAEAYLMSAAKPFDVIFFDPPFAQGLLASSCAAFESGAGWPPRHRSIWSMSEEGNYRRYHRAGTCAAPSRPGRSVIIWPYVLKTTIEETHDYGHLPRHFRPSH